MEHEEDMPFQVIHTLCGEPVFYYFGKYEDAKGLRNFDSITTLDGEAIVPDDLRACKNCGVKISLSQLSVAEHARNSIDPYEVKKDEGENKSIDPKLDSIVNEYREPTKKTTPDDDFWVTPDDTD